MKGTGGTALFYFRREMRMILRQSLLRGVNASFSFTANKVILMAIIVSFVMSGNIVTADKVKLMNSVLI